MCVCVHAYWVTTVSVLHIMAPVKYDHARLTTEHTATYVALILTRRNTVRLQHVETE